MMKRIGALAIALAAIAAAVWGRSLIDGNGGSTPSDNNAQVVCDVALADVCRARFGDAQLIIEAPGATFDRLVRSGAEAPAAWLAAGPWPKMVDDRRAGAGESPLFAVQKALASSPAVLVGRTDRTNALTAHCAAAATAGAPANAVDWKCLAAALGQSWSSVGGDQRWGRVTLGQTSGDYSDGLGSMSSAVAQYFGRTDASSNDFTDDDGFMDWFTHVERGLTSTTGDPLESFLTKPGSLSFVTTTEAHAALVATSRVAGQVTISYWDPAAVVPVVLATSSGSKVSVDSKALASALVSAGYRNSASAPKTSPTGPAMAAAASPTVDGSPTMLSPGVLTALRQLASEVTR